MSGHFGPRHKLVSAINWDSIPEGVSGWCIKIIGFYPNGCLTDDRSKDDYGFYTTTDDPNLFLSLDEAKYAAETLSSGSEDKSETFLVMLATVEVTSSCLSRTSIKLTPCGPYFACGKRL